MIDHHNINRPYIERLRHDRRTRALFEGWVAQAAMTAEPRARGDAHMAARLAAEEALKLALAFILDEDGEYRAVCAERDRYRDQLLETIDLVPPPRFVIPAEADAPKID